MEGQECQCLAAHSKANQKRQGKMCHSSIFLCRRVTHNNHLAGPHVQIWKRRSSGFTLLTWLSYLYLAYSWPVDSLNDLSVFGRDCPAPELWNLYWYHDKAFAGDWEIWGNEDSTWDKREEWKKLCLKPCRIFKQLSKTLTVQKQGLLSPLTAGKALETVPD